MKRIGSQKLYLLKTLEPLVSNPGCVVLAQPSLVPAISIAGTAQDVSPDSVFGFEAALLIIRRLRDKRANSRKPSRKTWQFLPMETLAAFRNSEDPRKKLP